MSLLANRIRGACNVQRGIQPATFHEQRLTNGEKTPTSTKTTVQRLVGFPLYTVLQNGLRMLACTKSLAQAPADSHTSQSKLAGQKSLPHDQATALCNHASSMLDATVQNTAVPGKHMFACTANFMYHAPACTPGLPRLHHRLLLLAMKIN